MVTLYRTVITAALLVGAACTSNDGGNVLRDYDGSVFQPGQVWRYHSRPGEEASTLTVFRVERHPKMGVIVHIAVSGVQVRTQSGTYSNELRHLPVSEEALRGSVTDMVRDGVPTDSGTEGYGEWRRAFDAGRAGVFTISVAESVKFVEQAVSQPRE